MKIKMNNRPIDRGGLTVFYISHFCCEARWRERKTHNLVTEYIEVQVCFDCDSDFKSPIMTKHFPVHMTLREIKCHTACCIHQKIKAIEKVIHQYVCHHAPDN